jgi:tetratricopeptide (TPR) repeat protein
MATGNAQAHLGLGQCARKRGDRSASLAIFQAAVSAIPTDLWLRIEMAVDLRELARLDEAEDACRQVLAMAPGNAQAHLGLGQCARKRGNRRSACAIFTTAIAVAPTDPWPRIELAAEMRNVVRLEEAVELYHQVLALRPGNLQAELGLGFCARLRGDRPAALAHFKNAARYHLDDPAPLLEIAVEQRDLGDADGARRTAEDVLARHPASLQAMLSIGISERYMGRYEIALEAFTAAHHAHPANAEPLVEMAVEARALGRTTECDGRLAQAQALDPHHVSVVLRLAEQATMANDIEGALAIFRCALLMQPGQITFRLGVVEALAAKGDSRAALVALLVLEQDCGPNPQISDKRLAIVRRSGESLLALSLARSATAAAPHHFQHWVERFHCEMLVGSDAEVDECLARMLPATLHQRAMVRRFTGNVAESRWQLADATLHYEAASVMNDRDAGIEHDLVRVKILQLDLPAALQHLRRYSERTAHLTRLQGRSPHISQTHYGQILDDYRLDEALLAKLTAIQPLQPSERVTRLLRLVWGNPDSTAAAVSLMVAWRQSGVLGLVAHGQEEPLNPIPNRLTQFWDCPKVPADIQELMQSWRLLNPHLTFYLFDDKAAQRFLAIKHPPSVLDAYRRAMEPAQKADIFRLACLVTEGGVYADADDRCLQPLTAIIPAHSALVIYQEDHATLGNNFIAARPGHPVLIRALRLATEAINRGDRDNLWLSTGPGLLTRAFTQTWAAESADTDGFSGDVVVLDRRALAQAVGIHCAAGYKKTEQHWSNTAFGKRRRPGSRAAPRVQTASVDAARY